MTLNTRFAATVPLAAPGAASWAARPRPRKGNDPTPRPSARSGQRGADLCGFRFARCPDPRADRKLRHRLREWDLCGNRGGSAHGPDPAPRRPYSNDGRGGGGVGIRRWRGTDRHGSAEAGRPGGGQAVGDVLESYSHSTDACDRPALSGIAGYQSGHPLRTLFACCQARRHCSRACPCRGRRFRWVSGTSGSPLRRSPVDSRGDAVDRSVPLGFPRSAVIAGPFEAVSRSGQLGCWGFVAGRWITRGVPEPLVPCGTVSPLFCLVRASMSGLQIPASDDPR